ncbi:ABC transporter ATP-binding protein [Vibrio cyclitrophicus]|nr:ABC transporter ATP-binding protein [Vibrio cyclitrophicus]UPR53138.1 ABC transporter ATP-binding protein [Vibrio cyclitrophicus]
MSEQTTRLSSEKLSVGYGDQVIVKNVDLIVEPNTITSLVGPNGCGKSTLLKAFARILPPQSGTVLINNKPIHSLPTRQVAQKIALLPQGPIAPEGLTVKELVAQGRFPHQSLFRQWSKQDTKAVERAIELTDLTQFIDRPVHSLSGGQRQRCWLAMVLAQDTPILLLDEPTTFLDLKVQVDLMDLLARIVKEEQRTILMVLHELNLAAAFTDRIIMMNNGEIVSQGSAQQVMRPEALKSVFGLHSEIISDPLTGRPVCLPRTPEQQSLSRPIGAS